MSRMNSLQKRSSCVFPDEPIFSSSSSSINFSNNTSLNGPGFERNYTIIVPVGNTYSISVRADDFAQVSGAGISAESHWDAQNKCIVPGSASSEYAEIDANASDVSFSVSYRNNGGPYLLDVSVTSNRSNMRLANSFFEGNPQCLGEYLWSLKAPFVNLIIRQALSQQGIDLLQPLPWEPSSSNPDGWNFSSIPFETIYTNTEERYSVKAGASFSSSTGAMEFNVGAYMQSGQTTCSIGVMIDTTGNVSVALTMKF